MPERLPLRHSPRRYSALLAMSPEPKHIGFSEEREWRVWCNEDVFAGLFDREIESLSGVVQDVYKIKFCGNSKSVSGLSADRLIKKIVIGPSPNQGILKKAFISLLDEAGVTNASAKVEMSGIPLRV